MLNRGWRDVVADILETSKNGANKTTIMYNSFISYTMLRTYFDLLLQSGLLAYDKKTRLYHTTRKGLMFLELYKKMNGLVFPSNMKLRRRALAKQRQ